MPEIIIQLFGLFFIQIVNYFVTNCSSGNYLRLVPRSLWHIVAPHSPTHHLKHFLLYGTTRCSGLISYVPCHSHFFKESWFLLFDNGIRNQDVGVGYAQCYWGITAYKFCQWKELGNIYMGTNPGTTNIYTYFCINLSLYIRLNTRPPMSPGFIQSHRFILALLCCV